MLQVAPAQVLPTNPCDEQIATKHGFKLPMCVCGFHILCFSALISIMLLVLGMLSCHSSQSLISIQ